VRWTAARTIGAPPERVFRAVADPEEFQEAIPGGSAVEYLTPGRSGVGTKFRATWPRVMNRLIARMVQKALDKDLDAVKAWCE